MSLPDEASWYRDILDRMGEMVCRFRSDGTLLYVNRAYCETLGVRAEDILGTSYAPVVHPDDLEAVQEAVSRMTADNPDIDILNRVVPAGGETIWTRWHNRGFFDERGALIEVQASGRDVTASIELEEQLKRSTDRLRFLAEASSALASSLDYETTLDQVTRLAVPKLADSCTVSLRDERGFTRVSVAHVDPDVERAMAAQAVGRDVEARSSEYRKLVERVLAGEVIHVEGVTDQHLDGFELDEETARVTRMQQIGAYLIVPMLARGRTIGTMALISSRAHSDRGWDEADVELARELAGRAAIAVDNARLFRELEAEHGRKDQFLATLAHELRNPMAALSAAVDTLQEPDLPADLREKALAVASRQVLQQSRMVDDLLDVSRLTRGRVELRRRSVSLKRAFEDIVDAQRPLAANRGLTLRVVSPEGEIRIEADPDRLQQIVGNLLDNAIKFTPPGGAIEVELRRGDDAVWIHVRDEGPGIPDEVRERVFDLFVQGPVRHETPSSGLGIGLTIARELVHLHGGHIEARPREGTGTEIVIRLPVGRIATSGKRESRSRVIETPLEILVVDDNPDAADTLALLLSSWGHRVRVAYGGHAALEAARARRPQLVLLDLGMPELDGYETARRLRRMPGLEHARIIALSGYAQPQDVEATQEAGFDRHAAKPITRQVLQEILAATGAAARHGSSTN